MPRIVKILLAIVILAVCIFLVLFIASRVAGYESVGALVEYLLGYLGFMADKVG